MAVARTLELATLGVAALTLALLVSRVAHAFHMRRARVNQACLALMRGLKLAAERTPRPPSPRAGDTVGVRHRRPGCGCPPDACPHWQAAPALYWETPRCWCPPDACRHRAPKPSLAPSRVRHTPGNQPLHAG